MAVQILPTNQNAKNQRYLLYWIRPWTRRKKHLKVLRFYFRNDPKRASESGRLLVRHRRRLLDQVSRRADEQQAAEAYQPRGR